LGDRKDIRPVKSWFVGGGDLTGAFERLIAPVAVDIITSIILNVKVKSTVFHKRA